MALEEEYEYQYKEKLDLPDLKPESAKVFAKICCPNCSAEVPVNEVNIDKGLGKCQPCNIVFSFDDQVDLLGVKSRKLEQEILRPEGIDLFSYEDQLDIVTDKSLGWLEWTFIIFSILAFFSAFGIMGETGQLTPGIFVMLSNIIINIGFYYWFKKQKLHINVDPDAIHIRQRPTLFKKDKRYDTSNISQLYVRKRRDMNLWNIILVVKEEETHKHLKLLTVNSISKAKYIEQEIENHLGIKNIIVPEESK